VGGPGGVWVLCKRAPAALYPHHSVGVLVAQMNLVNSPHEFLPLQLCILITNRPAPDIHENSALLSPSCCQAAYHGLCRDYSRTNYRECLNASALPAADRRPWSGCGSRFGPPSLKRQPSSHNPCSTMAELA
jgi:hypothetical protein